MFVHVVERVQPNPVNEAFSRRIIVSAYYRYPEDPTGSNPDNLVSGEIYQLSERPIRVAAPRYAPFFTESLIVYDDLSQQPLIRGQDYRIPMICREATLRFGKEIADAILIENPNVSNKIRITYQVLGGIHQNNIDNVVNIYEQFINDQRSVDWVTGIYGKPSEYPPSPHAHWLSDLFGFEPVTFQLERIAQAIQLGNTPAFEIMFEAMRNNIVSEEEIDRGLAVDKYLTLKQLIYAMDKFNFNSMSVKPNIRNVWNGGDLWFDLEANKIDDDVTYYWTIEHIGTSPEDFHSTSGLVHMVEGVGQFMVQTVRDRHAENNEEFRVLIRKQGVDGHILAKSRIITLARHDPFYQDRILEALRICCINSPRIKRTAKTHAVNRGQWRAPFN